MQETVRRVAGHIAGHFCSYTVLLRPNVSPFTRSRTRRQLLPYLLYGVRDSRHTPCTFCLARPVRARGTPHISPHVSFAVKALRYTRTLKSQFGCRDRPELRTEQNKPQVTAQGTALFVLRCRSPSCQILKCGCAIHASFICALFHGAQTSLAR